MKKTWFGKEVPDSRYLNTCPDVIYPKYGKFILTLDEVKAYFPPRKPAPKAGLGKATPSSSVLEGIL